MDYTEANIVLAGRDTLPLPLLAEQLVNLARLIRNPDPAVREQGYELLVAVQPTIPTEQRYALAWALCFSPAPAGTRPLNERAVQRFIALIDLPPQPAAELLDWCRRWWDPPHPSDPWPGPFWRKARDLHPTWRA